MAKAKEEQATVEADAAPPPRRRRRFLGPIATILLGLVGMAGGLVAAMGPSDAISLLTGGSPAAEQAEGHETADNSHAAPAQDGGHGAASGHGSAGPKLMVTPFKEMIVNITATTASGRQTTRFLKLNVALVYDEAAAGGANIEARKLYLRDSFQDYLRLLTERDLQGSYGLAMLKTELLRRARAISGSEAPQDILISDLIVQ